MKKGRKELPVPAIKNEVNDDAVRQSLEVSDTMTLAAQVFSAEAAEAHETLGKLKTAGGFKKIAHAAQILAYSQIQERKLFKHLAITHPDGSARPAQNFEEFCNLTNDRGYRSVMEDIQHFRALGYPVYEALKNADIDRKHFRALLKAPEEERQKLTESVDLADLDAVREHIEELAEEITKTEKALAAEREEHEASREQIAAKNKKIDELDKKLTKRSKHQPWDEEIKAFTVGLREATNATEENLIAYINGIQVIQERWDAASNEQRSSTAHLIIDEVNRVLTAAAALQNYVDAEISIHAGARAVPIESDEA